MWLYILHIRYLSVDYEFNLLVVNFISIYATLNLYKNAICV